MNRFLILLVVGALVSWGADAGNGVSADPAKVPSRADILGDFRELHGEAIETFFDKRDADPLLIDCRAALEELKTEYRKARAEKKASQMERVLIGTRDPKTVKQRGLAALLNECGRCVIKVTALPGANNYASDGWCRLPGGGHRREFERGVQMLSDPKFYARDNGGFNYVLRFNAVDAQGNETGNSESPYVSQVVVKGLFNFAFAYHINNHYGTRKTDAVDEFLLQFAKTDSPPLPRDFKFYEGGTKLFIWTLPKIHGQWFVDSDGNYRYFNQAEIAIPEELKRFVRPEVLALRIHTDTIFNMGDKLTEVTP